MDRRIKTNISNSLYSIRKTGQEILDPEYDPHDRIAVRKILIKIVQQCMALLDELDEDELQQEKDREGALLKKQEEEARSRLEEYRKNPEPDPDAKLNFIVVVVISILTAFAAVIYFWLSTPR
jgi:hypothetical protein